MDEIVVGLVLATLLVGMLALAFNAQAVKASGTVYVRADGSIDPPTAPIYRNGNVYTLTGNITGDADGIIVERDNIVVNGSGFTLEGVRADSSLGIYLDGRSNVTIQNTNVKNFSDAIVLVSSSNNSINGNTISNNNDCGIRLGSSSSNSINGNTITNNNYGISLQSSSSNSIKGNTITDNNYYGIRLHFSSSNSISENTMASNNYYGIELYDHSNLNSIGRNTIANSSDGIELYDHSNLNSIGRNTITHSSGYAVRLIWHSDNNGISENNITNNYGGIWLESSSNYNGINGNNIANNSYGIGLGDSSNNTVCHNNFIDNTVQVNDWTPEYTNFWDNGSEGNFWSNYNGTDANRDGVGDTPYIIEANSTDRYPLMSIIPEFPSLLLPALFMTATLSAVMVHKKRARS